ncbi:MAG TPA: hypothetical protein VGK67_34000 [Myxococcales bacterium]|jgi:hypothetical protein
MPVSLETFRSLVATKTQDQKITPAEVEELASQGPLTEEQKALVADALKSEYFASNSERTQAFAQLGIAVATPTPGGEGLTDKLKNKLVELAKDQVYASRDLSITDFKLGDRAGVGVRVQVAPLENDDPLVANDPHRAATTRRMQDAGQKVTWATVGGGIYPHAGFGFSVPAGPAKVNAGFSAGASLGYSVLAPYPLEAGSLKTLGKNLSVDLPFDASRARALTEGTEVRIAGRGTIAANVGVGAGATLADVGSLIHVGASANLGVGVSKEGSLSLAVKKLEGDKVFVSLSTVDSKAASVSGGVNVGVSVNLKDSLPDLGGSLFNQGGQLAAKAVEGEISKWANLDLTAAYSRSKTETVLQNYVIDLSTPEGAQAYDALLKLDTRAADKLGAAGSPSVAFAKLDEVGRTTHANVNLRLGKLELLQAVSGRTETHGTLDSSQGTITYDRARMDQSYSGILSNIWEGKRSMSAELVQTSRPGQPTDSYLHLSHTVSGDKVTTKGDVRRFLALSQMLGAQGQSLAAAQDDKKLLGSFGKTDRTVDVYVTDQGLQALAKASPLEIQKAFAKTYETLDRPWDMDYLIGGNKGVWTQTPWLATDHKDYGDIMGCLRGYRMGEENAQQLESSYRFMTGRSLNMDAYAFQQSQQFEALVTKLQTAATPAERAHVFAQADLSLDLEHELGTIALIAGGDAVMVNDLKLKDATGKGRDLTFVREGALQDPKAEIDRILARPG